MKNPEPSKSFLRYLFNKYTEINVTQKRFDEENTLIMINLSINKRGLASLVAIIDKYDIFYKNEIPQIIWLGAQKFSIKNTLDKTDDDIFHCKFNFITPIKGLFEINRISVQLYKKTEGRKKNVNTIQIEHITKPMSIVIG